uniref:Uncharacterized protein n=1 Tax=Anguilla anguilla TaxID=7936 RepID=A0A0E9QZJ2_ANGAN
MAPGLSIFLHSLDRSAKDWGLCRNSKASFFLCGVSTPSAGKTLV